MRFTVPQFIEREAKIAGPLTFKQFVFVGAAAVIILILYFVAPFLVFVIGGIVLAIAGIVLAFFKFSGRPIPIVLINILKFGFESKIYIWKKKEQPIVIYKKWETPSPAKTTEEELPLKIAEKSRLKKLHSEIETRTK